jgi:signal transduction histidine kinase
MQLHLAVDHMQDETPLRATLSRIQQLMAQVIDDSRSALRGLRMSDTSMSHDLAEAFGRIPNEIPAGEQVVFQVVVEGKRRALHPLMRDDVYRIGREAILNAFRHAQARHVHVEIDYAPKRLRVLVRDDGRGIAPSIASSGRQGHWGLAGMRERAERIGGRLSVSSRINAGTEVDLSVPGKVAYRVEPSRRWMRVASFIGKKQ